MQTHARETKSLHNLHTLNQLEHAYITGILPTSQEILSRLTKE